MQLLDARCCGNGKLTPPAGALGGPAPQVDATVVPPLPVEPARCPSSRRCPPGAAAPRRARGRRRCRCCRPLRRRPFRRWRCCRPRPAGFPPRPSFRRVPPCRCCRPRYPRPPTCPPRRSFRRCRHCRRARRYRTFPQRPDVPAVPVPPRCRPDVPALPLPSEPVDEQPCASGNRKIGATRRDKRGETRGPEGTAGEHENLQVKGSNF